MRVHWKSFLFEPFCVSNHGVRQGSVLSPFLFAVYLDGLLVELSKSGVGCHWGSNFAGAFILYFVSLILILVYSIIRQIRHCHGFHSPFESLIAFFSCH